KVRAVGDDADRPDAGARGDRLLAGSALRHEAVAASDRASGRDDRRLRQFHPAGAAAGRERVRADGGMIVRFAALVLLGGAAASALILAWGDRLGDDALRGALLGAGLAAAGAIGGVALFGWSLSRRTGPFVGALLVGFLGRLALFAAALIAVGL